MNITAKFNYDTVTTSNKNLHLLVQLTAPKLSVAETRRPLVIIPVLDISGSMDSNNKLKFAQESICKLIDHLSPTDLCGLVTFNNHVKVISTAIPMTADNKSQLRKQVNQLQACGGTDFGNGLLTGLIQANLADTSAETLVRVIMFTDGQANIGAKGQELLSLLGPNKKKASVSAFGYGLDADQDLLTSLSDQGQGNYAFIQQSDDAPTAFARELGGLLSTYGQNLKVKVQNVTGISNFALLNDYPMQDNQAVIPEILSEEVLNLLYRVDMAQAATSLPLTQQAIEIPIEISYEALENGSKVQYTCTATATLSLVSSPDQAQLVPNVEVEKLLALVQLNQAQKEAEKLAAQGQYAQAQQVMSICSADFTSRGLQEIGEMSSKLGGKMSSSSEFLRSSGYRGSARVGLKGKLALADADCADDLQNVGVSYTNSTQAATIQSFASPTPVITTGK